MIAVEHLIVPRAGETESGDAVVVRHGEGRSMVAVVDALGHGPAAAAVARSAIECLNETKLDESVVTMMERLHHHLRGSRGAAVMVCLLAAIDPSKAHVHARVPSLDGGRVIGRAGRHDAPPAPSSSPSNKTVHIEGCGIGNVDMRSYRTRVPAVLTPGVVGVTASKPRRFEADLGPGDRVLMFSDGITPSFAFDLLNKLKPVDACRAFMERHRRSHDDATIVVTDIDV